MRFYVVGMKIEYSFTWFQDRRFPMAASKKTVSKSVKVEKRPAAKTTTKAAPQVQTSTESAVAKETMVKKDQPTKKILTAEGWKRMMLREKKSNKGK